MGTWGATENIPEGIAIRFFVGEAEKSTGIVSGSEDDLADLAKQAGIMDTSMIVVMNGVTDNEYPPVRKNAALIENAEKVVSGFENNPEDPSTFQWIYKVDDDAYVNVPTLVRFTRKRNPEGFHVYGERGTGRKEDAVGLLKGGLKKAYCTGGPGYILSRSSLQETAAGMSSCVANAEASEYKDYLWHSDVVIGICVEQQTGQGCWSDGDADYNKHRIFRNNFDNEYPFLKDTELVDTIASHPFKDVSSMLKQHTRYIKLEAKAK